MKRFYLSLLAIFMCGTLAHATAYYGANASTSPVGNDSNSGTDAGHPWLTPNHALNCGDSITFAASTAYSDANFTYGNWGTVTCAAGNDVAMVMCATFDGCKITSSSGNGAFWVDKSYWGVRDWEVIVTTGAYGQCFVAAPNLSTPANLHHVIFANNVANGCYGGGIVSTNHTTHGVDYLAIVGNIVYNAAQGNGACFSGISVYAPVASDSLPGTHIYIAGNLSYANVDPNPCAGTAPTDGEGVFFDTFDGSQGGVSGPYTQQAVADNNISLSNGGPGVDVFNNQAGATQAAIYFRHNTSWGNNTDASEAAGTFCGDTIVTHSLHTEVYSSIAFPTAATACGGNTLYSYFVGFGSSTNAASVVVYRGVGYSATATYSHNSNTTSFAFGPNNLLGTNPTFAGATTPGAPSCSGKANTVDCMSTVIANFTPTNTAAIGYGYQTPSTTSVYDPLYPQWLCSVTNLPTGLVTPGCVTGEQWQ